MSQLRMSKRCNLWTIQKTTNWRRACIGTLKLMLTSEARVVRLPTAERYRAIARIVPIVLLLAALYGAILRELFLYCWNTPAFSQGLLIPPFVLYLIYLRRRAISAVLPGQDSRGLLAITVGGVLLLVGKLAAEFFITRISFIVMLAGLVWTFWGVRRLHVLALPLLLLATAVPIPALLYSTLSAPLQLLASEASASAAEWLGVTLYRDGNIIQLHDISLGIEEACNGLASLSSLFVAALLLGFVSCRRRLSRTLVIVLAIPVAILGNITRITGTAVLSDWKPALAFGFYHGFSGWLVFVVGVLILYGVTEGVRRVLES